MGQPPLDQPMQVEAGMGGVDVSEEGLVFIELRLCETRKDYILQYILICHE